MTWTAPEVDNMWPEPLAGGERTLLEGVLDRQRRTLLRKCAGLTGEQLAQRVVPPSNLSLLGLIRHMAQVERGWFRHRVAGEDAPRLFPRGSDLDWEGADAAKAQSDYVTLVAEMDTCRMAANSANLDDEFDMENWGRMVTVRWVYLHMIEEYARHNGHADFLRERIDGATGP